MDTSRYAALFLAESQDQVRACEAALEAWARTPGGPGPVAELFRAFHTIKGMAATMGYARLAAFAHEAESLLDAVRAGRVPGSADLGALLLEAVDALAAGVEDAVAGADGRRLDGALESRMASLAGAGAGSMPARPTVDRTPAPATPGLLVTVRVRAGIPMPWARAVLVLRRAAALGEVHDIVPAPGSSDVEHFDGRLAFTLAGGRPGTEVEAALRDVGDVEVEVRDTGQGTADPVVRVREEVRVSREELDRLLLEVGELVVAGNRLAEAVERRADPALEQLTAGLTRWTEAVHHRVLRARMVPVGEVFDRFPRVVRELARELGRSARVELTGRDIELDRSVLAALGDPLLHLVRNAMDHGLEPPAERAARGKPPEGVIRLEARRDRDAVEIRVADDGRGIDRSRILARLGAEGAGAPAVDDAALLQVLARPGFSTAEAVTGVSGRGVGVDAVVTRVRGLGGSVALRSEPGTGTEFTLRLPLTLAVVPTLVVGLAAERYAVPLARVSETGGGVPERRGEQLVVSFRGEFLPATDLREEVGVGGTAPAGRRPFLVAAGAGGRRRALLVDFLLGRQDLVVSPLDRPAGAPAWLTGAATLADGVPALLVDPLALLSVEAA